MRIFSFFLEYTQACSYKVCLGIDEYLKLETLVDTVDETVDVEADVKEVKPKRARNKKGQLKGDDPSTPDVNEAWEGGKAPKKTTKKKTTTKKTTKKKSS